MRKLFLLMLSLFVAATSAGAGLLYSFHKRSEISDTIKIEVSKIIFQQLQTLTGGIRQDLLANNTRGARILLESASKDSGFDSFQIFKGDAIAESSDAFGEQKTDLEIKTSVPIFFGSSEGPKWGRVDFYSRQDSVKIIVSKLNSLQLQSSVLVSLITVFSLLICFGILLFSATILSNIIREFLKKEELGNVGKFTQFVWSPLLSMLGETANKSAKIRADLENNRKQAAIARVSQSIAHDIRTPVATIEQVLHACNWAEFEAFRFSLKSAFNRLNSLIDALKKSDTDLFMQPSLENFEIGHVVDELQILAQEKGKNLFFEIDSNVNRAFLDFPKFERALINLIINALEADSKFVRVLASRQGSTLLLSVEDDGSGVPVEISSLLFSRGTTFGKSGGSGLGLNFVHSVAQGHGGELFYKRIGSVTHFVMEIPNALPPPEKDLNNLILNPFVPAAQLFQSNICIELASKNQENIFRNAALEHIDSALFVFGVDSIKDPILIYSDVDSALEFSLKYGCAFEPAAEKDDPKETLGKLLRRRKALLQLEQSKANLK